MMGTKVPTDIRFDSLASGGHGHPYNEEEIKRAIKDGVEPDGERLDSTMPRYDMSEEDLEDLIGFLKILD